MLAVYVFYFFPLLRLLVPLLSCLKKYCFLWVDYWRIWCTGGKHMWLLLFAKLPWGQRSCTGLDGNPNGTPGSFLAVIPMVLTVSLAAVSFNLFLFFLAAWFFWLAAGLEGTKEKGYLASIVCTAEKEKSGLCLIALHYSFCLLKGGYLCKRYWKGKEMLQFVGIYSCWRVWILI